MGCQYLQALVRVRRRLHRSYHTPLHFRRVQGSGVGGEARAHPGLMPWEGCLLAKTPCRHPREHHSGCQTSSASPRRAWEQRQALPPRTCEDRIQCIRGTGKAPIPRAGVGQPVLWESEARVLAAKC